MQIIKKVLLCVFLSLAPLFIVPDSGHTMAQCPMCRMSAESNLENGGSAGKGLNKGIFYLFVTPYLLIGGLAYFWYKNKKDNAL